MSKKPTYAELQARLEQAEATLAALRRGEIDTLMGETEPLLVRYKSAIDELARLRTEAERLAQDWQITFDATNDAIWILDREHRVLRTNKTGERIFQRRREELIGKHCWEIVHGTTQPIPECPILRARHSLHRESTELQIGESWFEVTADLILDAAGRYGGAVHIISDITERKRTEAQLRASLKRLDVLNRIGQSLAQTLDLPSICRAAYQHISQLVDCPNFGISLYDAATRTLRAEFVLSDGEPLDVSPLPPLEIESEPIRGRNKALLTGQPEVMNNLPSAAAESKRVMHIGNERIPLSALYMPMIVEGQVRGLVEMQSYRLNAYSTQDVELLAPVADQIGLALENARLYRQAQQEIAERKKAEEKIKEQLDELQRWYAVMLDREDRTLELKREVNELLRRLNEPIRYPSAEAAPE